MQPGKPWNSNRTQNRKGVGVRKGVRVKIQYCIFTLTPFLLTPFLLYFYSDPFSPLMNPEPLNSGVFALSVQG
jgi:hypothetical protein